MKPNKILIVVLLFVYSELAFSQPGSIDSTFNTVMPNTSSASVRCAAIQEDGKIIICGNFRKVNNQKYKRIARLNPDGSLDTTFRNVNVYWGGVSSIVIQEDGKIVIAGGFARINGHSINCIARLNPDGSLDTTFKVGRGATSQIYKILIQDDGKLLMVGDFFYLNKYRTRGLARIYPDGTIDSTFRAWAHRTYDMVAIFDMDIQKDGKIIIVGNFGSYDDVGTAKIARLNKDGTLDRSFLIKGLWSGWINCVEIQENGKILIGGVFSKFNNQKNKSIVRLNEDGTLDSTFITGKGINFFVEDICLQSNGKIIVAGNFSKYNGNSVNGICRLEPDGTLDKSFNYLNGRIVVSKVVLQKDNKILLLGFFESYRKRIIRILL